MDFKNKMFVSVDVILLGFDGALKVLAQKDNVKSKKRWSVINGTMELDESVDDVVNRLISQYIDGDRFDYSQIEVLSEKERFLPEKAISIVCLALVDMTLTKEQNDQQEAKWLTIEEFQNLRSGQVKIIEKALAILRQEVEQTPIAFRLLPQKFTLLTLHKLYTAIHEKEMDKRNFTRRMVDANLIKKLDEKEKTSRKGSHFYIFVDGGRFKKKAMKLELVSG